MTGGGISAKLAKSSSLSSQPTPWRRPAQSRRPYVGDRDYESST